MIANLRKRVLLLFLSFCFGSVGVSYSMQQRSTCSDPAALLQCAKDELEDLWQCKRVYDWQKAGRCFSTLATCPDNARHNFDHRQGKYVYRPLKDELWYSKNEALYNLGVMAGLRVGLPSHLIGLDKAAQLFAYAANRGHKQSLVELVCLRYSKRAMRLFEKSGRFDFFTACSYLQKKNFNVETDADQIVGACEKVLSFASTTKSFLSEQQLYKEVVVDALGALDHAVSHSKKAAWLIAVWNSKQDDPIQQELGIDGIRRLIESCSWQEFPRLTHAINWYKIEPAIIKLSMRHNCCATVLCGLLAFERNEYEQARQSFSAAAGMGNEVASCYLANMHLRGLGCKKSAMNSFGIMRKVVDNECARKLFASLVTDESMHELRIASQENDMQARWLFSSVNFERGRWDADLFGEIKSLAAQDDVYFQWCLACMSHAGKGTEQSLVTAVKYYAMLCQGDPTSTWFARGHEGLVRIVDQHTDCAAFWQLTRVELEKGLLRNTDILRARSLRYARDSWHEWCNTAYNSDILPLLEKYVPNNNPLVFYCLGNLYCYQALINSDDLAVQRGLGYLQLAHEHGFSCSDEIRTLVLYLATQEKSESRRRSYLGLAAAHGSENAVMDLAIMDMDKKETCQEMQAALDFLERYAAISTEPSINVLQYLGAIHFGGKDVHPCYPGEQNLEKSYKYFSRLLEVYPNNSDAQYSLGMILFLHGGMAGMPVDNKRVYQLLKAAKESGHKFDTKDILVLEDVAFQCGEHRECLSLLQGMNNPFAEWRKTLSLIAIGAEARDVFKRLDYALIILGNKFVLEKDLIIKHGLSVMQWLNEHMQRGDIHAKSLFARMGVLYGAEGIKSLQDEARDYLAEAMHAGDVYAQSLLAYLYMNGIWNEQSFVQAFNLLIPILSDSALPEHAKLEARDLIVRLTEKMQLDFGNRLGMYRAENSKGLSPELKDELLLLIRGYYALTCTYSLHEQQINGRHTTQSADFYQVAESHVLKFFGNDPNVLALANRSGAYKWMCNHAKAGNYTVAKVLIECKFSRFQSRVGADPSKKLLFLRDPEAILEWIYRAHVKGLARVRESEAGRKLLVCMSNGYRLLANAYVSTQKAKCERYICCAVELYPEDTVAVQTLVDMYVSAGKREKIRLLIHTLEGFAREEGASPSLYLNLGMLIGKGVEIKEQWVVKRDYNRAMSYLEAALRNGLQEAAVAIGIFSLEENPKKAEQCITAILESAERISEEDRKYLHAILALCRKDRVAALQFFDEIAREDNQMQALLKCIDITRELKQYRKMLGYIRELLDKHNVLQDGKFMDAHSKGFIDSAYRQLVEEVRQGAPAEYAIMVQILQRVLNAKGYSLPLVVRIVSSPGQMKQAQRKKR